MCACLPVSPGTWAQWALWLDDCVSFVPFFLQVLFLVLLPVFPYIMLWEWNKIFVPFFFCVCFFVQPLCLPYWSYIVCCVKTFVNLPTYYTPKSCIPLYLPVLLRQNICKLTAPLKLRFLSVCQRCCVKVFVSLTPLPPTPANYLCKASSIVEQANKLLNKQINCWTSK